ncbi:MAG: enoyl-CoA hydratase-related protein [Novosphingobium sp.]|uniref:enoyl-CoA hydratase/isomerase family protein n=1 Tax=Sulfitobacter sp. MOLA879 TaxID=3368579 RepID=UPI0035810C43
MNPTVKFSRSGQIGRVRISNPAKHNALTTHMWSAFEEGIRAMSRTPGLRCIIVTGDGTRAFAAGADIAEFAKVRRTVEQVTTYHEEIVQPALGALIESDLVSIAAINGDCTGGGLEIAAACDLRVCAQRARLGAAVARLGFPLALAETEILVRKFGFALAAEILLEGRLLTANEAEQKGLVGRVVPDDQLPTAAEDVARNVSDLSPMALRLMKRQFRRLITNPEPVAKAERAEYYDFALSSDYREGCDAFLNKRDPQFKEAQ